MLAIAGGIILAVIALRAICAVAGVLCIWAGERLEERAQKRREESARQLAELEAQGVDMSPLGITKRIVAEERIKREANALWLARR